MPTIDPGISVGTRWGALALRGVAAVILGALSLAYPGLTFLSLVVGFGVFAIVDGAFSLVGGVAARGEPRLSPTILRGVASLAAGALALLWPAITALVLLLVIAAWAMGSGLLEIATAIRLSPRLPRSWILALAGALSVIFGAVLLAAPGAGAVALGLWVGAFFLVLGALSIAGALELRKATPA